MRRMHHLVLGLLSTGAILGAPAAPVSAGFGLFGCKKDCSQPEPSQCNCDNKCCKPKKHCCLCPPDAPEGEIGFAQAGVIRPGIAARVNVNEASLIRPPRNPKANAESSAVEKTPEERLSALEADVSKMGVQLDRITTIVEKLAKESVK